MTTNTADFSNTVGTTSFLELTTNIVTYKVLLERRITINFH